jgi:CcmD family protein
MKLKRLLFILLASTLFSVAAVAQSDIEMADMWHTNGKIYVVVAVLAVIFVGIVVYLITLDRKLRKLEKRD